MRVSHRQLLNSNTPSAYAEGVFFIAERKRQYNDAIPLAIVVHNEKELIGVLELKRHENKNYPEYEYWIGGVFVDPIWRGQGVAGSRIAMAKEKAKQLDIHYALFTM